MKEKVEEIKRSVSEKGGRLKEKANRRMSAILNMNVASVSDNNKRETSKTPPITWGLYAVAAVCALKGIRAFSTDEVLTPLVLIGLGTASAYIGYNISKKSVRNKKSSSASTQVDNFEIRVKTATDVVTVAKEIIAEWDDFMSITQRNIQEYIKASDLSEQQKHELLSKIALYERINISLTDFHSAVNSIPNATSFMNLLQKEKNDFTNKLIAAIETAVNKQIDKYSSLYK